MSFNSSNLFNYASIAIPDYLEYAWVTTPDDTGQAITANTITQCTLNTEKADTGNYGTLSSNQIILAAGTYTVEVSLPSIDNLAGYTENLLQFYNVTDSIVVTGYEGGTYISQVGVPFTVKCQFTITSTKTFEVRYACSAATTIGRTYTSGTHFTLTTAGAAQRTTVRLWRYKDTFSLGSLFAGGAGQSFNSYAEFAWVTAPNTAGQSITANTITTLTIDTEVQDIDNIGSIASNQITLVAGTYYFESNHIFKRTVANNPPDCFLRLYNVTDSTIVSGESGMDMGEFSAYGGKMNSFRGSFVIASSKTFRLEVGYASDVNIGVMATTFSLSTAGAQQRTTIKFWKK